MKNTLILYESGYGFTKMAAEQAALILGPGKCMRFSEFLDNGQEWDLVVLLIPVYYEQLKEDAVLSIKNNLDWLKQRKIVLFCTCLAVEYADRYLYPLKELLGDCVAFQSGITGNLILDQLKEPDKEQISIFFKTSGLKEQDYICFNQESYIETLLSIKGWNDCPVKIMDEESYVFSVKNF